MGQVGEIMTHRIRYATRSIARILRRRQYGYTFILPAAIGAIPYTACADSYFHPAFLSGDNSAVADLSRFENSN